MGRGEGMVTVGIEPCIVRYYNDFLRQDGFLAEHHRLLNQNNDS